MGWLVSPSRVYLVTCAHSDASVPLNFAVAWYIAILFITKRWLAFIRRTKNLSMPKFLLFDVFRRKLKIPGENPVCYLPPKI